MDAPKPFEMMDLDSGNPVAVGGRRVAAAAFDDGRARRLVPLPELIGSA